MRSTASSYARTCESCGEPLAVKEIELFGRPFQATCYGSCGCGRSRERLERYGPLNVGSEESAHRCQMCGGTMRVGSWPGYVSECPWCGYSCVFASDLAAMDSERRAERAMRAGGILAGTGVPELYWNVEPDYQRAERVARTGKGLYIVGHGNGTLKTLTAAAVAKAYAEQGRSVRYVSSTMMLEDFKATFGTSKSEAELVRDLAACDLLIIDDIGKEQPTSWAAATLYTVIDTRYGSGYPPPPMVVTTNFEEHELVARMARTSDESTATATMSRIYEMTEKLTLDGPDRRLL